MDIEFCCVSLLQARAKHDVTNTVLAGCATGGSMSARGSLYLLLCPSIWCLVPPHETSYENLAVVILVTDGYTSASFSCFTVSLFWSR